MFARFLQGNLPHESCFLFGPRQVGKTTLLRGLKSVFYADLLDPDEQLAYSKNPNLLREQLEAVPQGGTVIIDEIQRVPKLLDVVQSIMDRSDAFRFVMSGSSARKLRHGHANLLGGRAQVCAMHPLTIFELAESFRLDKVLAYGSLPPVCSKLTAGKENLARSTLRSYVTTYIREEIKAEALVRNLQGFQNFVDVAAAQFAQQVNMSLVGRECRVAYATVREYYAILEDTLMGFFLKPFARSERKRMSLAPKFYFFDNGVTRALLGTLRDPPGPLERGRLFEQWFIQEVRRLNEYREKDFILSFWRTSHGAEVDLLVERAGRILCAVECKHGSSVSAADLSGLRSFLADHPDVPGFVAAPVRARRKIGDVIVEPPKDVLSFLEDLA